MSTGGFDPAPLCGWVYRAVETPQIAASLGPPLRQRAAALYAEAPPAQVLLFRAWKDVLGAYPNYPAQEIGDCESFGHGHAHDLLQCVEASTTDAALEYQETDTEALYGMGREAGGMLGNQDGCDGASMVKAMTTMGLVSRQMLGSDGTYSGSRAKSWGKTGTPAAIKQQAIPFKIGAAALVTTWVDLQAALANGYPITVSSNQGFSLTRNSDGFCSPKGTWNHCMHITGYRTDIPGALICNSWGSDSPTGPLALDQPPFSFWASQATVSRMLAQRDSYAISKAPGFAKKQLPSHWTYSAFI